MSHRPALRAVSHRRTAPAPARTGPASVRRPIAALLERPLGIAFIATLGVLGAIVFGWAIGSITTILIYIVLALFVALGLDPGVRLLERRGMHRGAAIGVVFGAFALLALGVLVFVLPPVFAQIGEFFRAIPSSVAELEATAWFGALSPDAQAAVRAGLDEFTLAVSKPEFIAAIGGGALAIGVGIANAVTAGFIVVALTLYFLSSLGSMKQALYALAPARNRPRLTDMTERVTASVGSSLLGSVILAAINAAVVLVLHLLIGLPYAALMATFAFVITLIPLFGSVIFLVVASLVALFSSPTQALIFAICYLVYIQIESYVVTPRVMNRAISIPAALVLIGAMIGGALLGILGVVIALPVMATILLIIREVVIPKQDLKV
ncbi:AI-2E family transporter [Microbacterium rhizomatis]|uniref:AI-2E family transporter n=1 Tax=Microbacterium rhizomatis TaxID=1631477 RepID=A0A5J5J8G0_9MICO|nr:AI-2E family transporter [Microbacterium rhizomatis]KAA9111454.1 AI-2E family transporter [Microbacterium rhizomatis]